MLVLVTGGVRNGKSVFGEELCLKINGGRLCYIAAMYRDPDDPEVAARIARHREMRKDKGFDTVERYYDIGGLILDGYDTVLLECLPNLLANEMFMRGNKDAGASVLNGLEQLLHKTRNLVVITNEISSDGMEYSAETELYLKTLGLLNRKTAGYAQEVYEVCCGIPVQLK